MRYLIFALIAVLCSCSKLTDEEKLLVGKWEWNFEKDGFKDSGYLDLRNDGKYSYVIEVSNPTEKISDIFSQPVYEWSIKNGTVCMAKGENEQEMCSWNYDIDFTGNPTIEFQSVVITDRLIATRK